MKTKEKVIKHVNLGINCTAVSYIDDGLPIICQQAAQESHLTDSYYYLSVLDLEAYSSETIVERIQTKIETSENGRLLVLVDDIDLLSAPKDLVLGLDALQKSITGVQYLYIIENPITIDNLAQLLPPDSSIFGSIIYKTLGNMPEITIGGTSVNLNDSTISQDHNSVLTKSSGHWGTARKLYMRQILDTEDIDEYWRSLTTCFSEQDIRTLRKFILGLELSPQEARVIEQLRKVGVISNGYFKLGFLKKYILASNLSNSSSTGPKNKQEVFTAIELDLFNKTERSILKALFKGNGTLTKEEVADILWPNNAAEKYSDWAIDKKMSRLRKKIKGLAIPFSIETVYGSGYKLNLH
jgi:hypothetical protein